MGGRIKLRTGKGEGGLGEGYERGAKELRRKDQKGRAHRRWHASERKGSVRFLGMAKMWASVKGRRNEGPARIGGGCQ